MESGFIHKVRQTLDCYSMINRGDSIVVGVSGGVDSMTLLDVLHRLKDAYRLQLVVAHLHHGLRGEEAEREFRLVEEQSCLKEIPFEGKRIAPGDYSGTANIQAQARMFRYRYYEEVAQKWDARKIATGHHEDDQVETLLIQIFRGTGGLKGLLPVRDGRYIRPLLAVCKKEIQSYANLRQLSYCEDSSNLKRTYLRNRIRQELVPWVQKEVNPSFSDSLLRLASILQEEANCLDSLALQAFKQLLIPGFPAGEIVLKRKPLEETQKTLQKRVIRAAYKQLAGSTDRLSYVHVQKICEALRRGRKKPHSEFSLPSKIHVFIEYETVRFSRSGLWDRVPYRYRFSAGERLFIPQAGISIIAHISSAREATLSFDEKKRNRVFLDTALTKNKMHIRNFQPGDRFYPLGLGGEKKLKDFFIDQKIPRSLRCKIPILVVDGKIAWVVGYRIDERFKVTENSRSCIQIEVIQEDTHGI